MRSIAGSTALYLVPTPIGNLEDMTLRAIKVLGSVSLILAEDTRTSSVLLRHYGIATPVKSYHAFNEHRVTQELVDRMHAGEVMALISDAGTPGISDPGYLLVRAALQAGLAIECLPGATALIPALVKSGFTTDRFVFEGFLPHKKGRMKRIAALANEERTIVLYESPHRLIRTLGQLAAALESGRRISVSRELSKMHEETITGTPAEVLEALQAGKVRGELVLVIEGREKQRGEETREDK
jgi:16S rRNA (cytidine1402-2'-O)-methyltransferase